MGRDSWFFIGVLRPRTISPWLADESLLHQDCLYGLSPCASETDE